MSGIQDNPKAIMQASPQRSNEQDRIMEELNNKVRKSLESLEGRTMNALNQMVRTNLENHKHQTAQ